MTCGGGVHLSTDGQIDPTGLTHALAAGAKSRGARFLVNTRVLGIGVHNNEIKEVVTDHGTIQTEIVVNAAGLWGNEIARMVGLTLPVIPMAHLYLVTKPVKNHPQDLNMPTMRDPDNLVYFRGTASGLIAGGYERHPKPWALNGIPQDWNFKLLEPDWDRFTPLMENAIKRVPALETVEIAQLLNGPEGFTPDSEYLLGPTTVRGFWVACAFCAHGIAGAGGIGKAMAEWIIEGYPEWDMWKLDVRRFGTQYGSQAYTLARTVETYSQYYDIHLPWKNGNPHAPFDCLQPTIVCRNLVQSSERKAAGNGPTGSPPMSVTRAQMTYPTSPVGHGRTGLPPLRRNTARPVKQRGFSTKPRLQSWRC
ncbi:MAG: FAD-dependent oxidoreductase [Anaerolineae bacterium]|nr:FAD-dependent oxidoreductase [Anaerolineae bacterium]